MFVPWRRFFRSVRCVRRLRVAAPRVAAVPYDVVSTDEARALADGNPLSFLHVSRAEIDLPPGTDPVRRRGLREGRARTSRAEDRGAARCRRRAGVYLYRLRMGAHEQTGLAACFSLDEYDRDVIKKHERTRRDKEDDRTRHMIELRAQTGPVFLTYRASHAVDAVCRARRPPSTPLFDFTAADGVQHTIWRVDGADEARARRRRSARSRRCTSPTATIAPRAPRARGSSCGGQPAAPGQCGSRSSRVAFPDNQMQILPYNRIVKDLGGRTRPSRSSRRCASGSR